MGGFNKRVSRNADFAFFEGIQARRVNGCNQASNTDVAFAHLLGVHTLIIFGCNQAAYHGCGVCAPAGHLRLHGRLQITDTPMVHLRVALAS